MMLNGFGYSVAEALSVNVPVIVTDVTAFKEIGVKDGENGFVCDFDMENVDVNKIYEYRNNFDFDYKPPKDKYDELFAKGKSQYQEGFKKKAMVEAIINPYFYDVELKENKQIGEKYIVTKNRADDLVDKKLVKFIKDVENKKKREK